MATKPSASFAFVPANADHAGLVDAAARCRACDLYKQATRVVFGEGPRAAKMMLVGEQPGDQEDRSGHPFVGPAGKLLDGMLADAEIPRHEVYVTNTVKHFKWEPRGKRRIHAKPNAVEVNACRGWLEREIGLVKPDVIVCLGATAAQALLGRTFRLTQHRGVLLEDRQWARWMLATYHPSALLRMHGDDEDFRRERDDLVRDLATAASVVRCDRAGCAGRNATAAAERTSPR